MIIIIIIIIIIITNNNNSNNSNSNNNSNNNNTYIFPDDLINGLFSRVIQYKNNYNYHDFQAIIITKSKNIDTYP